MEKLYWTSEARLNYYELLAVTVSDRYYRFRVIVFGKV
jgi:hypothetical protein